MTDHDEPSLSPRGRAWYRDLTRYQWWVLFLASLGWMFDTMDQQFFNLARGPAMAELLGYDPVRIGRGRLGAHAREDYSPADLDKLVEAKLLSEAQRVQLSADRPAGDKRPFPREQVASVIGQEALAGRYIELGQENLAGHPGETFDEAGLDKLVGAKVISAEFRKKLKSEQSDGRIPRGQLAGLIGENVAKIEIQQAGRDVTTLFILGWAAGGLFFGYVGDRIGRVKTMALTILIYALFTGLSGVAQTWWQFALFRILTALGVGGEFAAGASLVAETMSERVRPFALGTLQALSAVGNVMGGMIAFYVTPTFGWRWLFAVGTLPALLAVVVRMGLREPEKWQAVRDKARQPHQLGKGLGSYAGLLGEARWRRNAIVGLLLGVIGVAGLWGVAFFSPELTRIALGDDVTEAHRERITALTFVLQQVGAFFGIAAYTWLAPRMGRRGAFAVFFVLAFLATSYTFLFLDTELEAFYLLPILGFATLGPFGGYAIYFPELFPTRLRATGTGFCYNVGRFLAAFSSSVQGWLSGMFNSGKLVVLFPFLAFLSSAQDNAELSTRYASVTMASVYLLGLVVLLFAPETKGQPLPEE